jgi:hypothetical protein
MQYGKSMMAETDKIDVSRSRAAPTSPAANFSKRQ